MFSVGPTCYLPSLLTSSDLICPCNTNGITYPTTHIQNFKTDYQPCFLPGIIGERSAIRLFCNLKQYVTIDYRFDFRNISFSISTWIYLYSNQPEMTIFAQCRVHKKAQCLFLRIKNQKMLFGFYGSDTSGNTTLKINHWHHVAFVYNYTSRTQTVYLDGIVNGRGSSSVYLGVPYNITIGRGLQSTRSCFHGLIDRISLVNRALRANEILKEATLSAYYPFNNSTELDSGPNKIIGLANNVIFTEGIFHQSLLFSSENYFSYFQAQRLFLLGVSERSYSLSFWIRTSLNHASGSIIYATSENDWCLPILGFNQYGQIIAQSSDGNILEIIGQELSINTWNHIALTYEYGQHLDLYQNGVLIDSIGPFNFAISGSPVTLTLGFLDHQANCYTQSIIPGPFDGAIDDFQVYSRYLTILNIQEIMQMPGTSMHYFE